MSEILTEQIDKIGIITLNRPNIRNAFDDKMLQSLQQAIVEFRDNPSIHVILIKANGPDFSAGADANWMKKIASLSQKENLTDALILANTLYTLYSCHKPTIAVVQGSAYGGGAGIAAVCDVAIGTQDTRFCFSEVKLGLIPAVISPYVINAIGARATTALFVSAEVIDGQRALQLQLLQHCVATNELQTFAMEYAQKIIKSAPLAVQSAKQLVRDVAGLEINQTLVHQTAEWIAEQRVSEEGQHGLTAFLNKEIPNWNR